MIKLIVEHDMLCTPHDAIVEQDLKTWWTSSEGKPENPALVYRYPEGDCDILSWPNPNFDHLRSVLFDAREEGLIDTVDAVELPDGTIFTI